MNETKQYISPSRRRALDVSKYFAEKFGDDYQSSINSSTHQQRFFDLCEKAKRYLFQIYDKKVEVFGKNEKEENYVEIFHEALIGKPEATSMLKKHIEDYLKVHVLTDIEYPKYYTSLVEAIFEENFGWGPLSVWKRMPDSEGAQVLGTEIKFKNGDGWELQPFKFRNIKQVEELCGRFANISYRNLLNEHTKPELETVTYDNHRVSIMIPNLMYEEPVITLRRKVVTQYQLESIAEYGTMPFDSIDLFRALAKFNLNSIIAGAPGTGKSTFLQAILNEVLFEYKGGKRIPERYNSIYAESTAEFDIRKIFPTSNVLHIIGQGDDFMKKIGKTMLRHDIYRVVLGEIREHEVGLYYRSGLQGIKQVIGTMHDLDPRDIPEILSTLYVTYHPYQINPEQVYLTMARNLHFSISMDEFEEDGVLVKRVTGIQFYDVENREVKMYPIMIYDYNERTWRYSSIIPTKIKRIVEKYRKKEWESFMQVLMELEAKNPMLLEEKELVSTYE